MDYESALNQALDLLADGEDRKADRLLQSIIDFAKTRIKLADEDVEAHYYWGRALEAMDEPEQALLRFERVLQIEPAHELALWETASIFLHDLDRPESARLLLAEKLIPMSPDNVLYQESLRAADFHLRLKKSPPGAEPGKSKGAAPSQPSSRAADAAREAGKREGGAGKPDARNSEAARRAREREESEKLSEQADRLLAEAGDLDEDDWAAGESAGPERER